MQTNAETRLPDEHLHNPPSPFSSQSSSSTTTISPNPRRRRRRRFPAANTSPALSIATVLPRWARRSDSRAAALLDLVLRFSICVVFGTSRRGCSWSPSEGGIVVGFGRIPLPSLRSVVPPAVAFVPDLLGFRILEPLDFARLAPRFASGCGCRLPIRIQSC